MSTSPPSPSAARLLLGDCIEAMAGMDAASIDAVICDPPYGLEFMGKEWDKFGRNSPPSFEHSMQDEFKGFNPLPRPGGLAPEGMHAFQEWSQQWAVAASRVLKPGGFLLAFGGTRTQHRLAVAVEDAGFDIRDRVLVLGSLAAPVEMGPELDWVYGSGFPKSLDVSKQIDKAAGVEREVVGERVLPDSKASRLGFRAMTSATGKSPPPASYQDTAPASDDAKQWDGWGTALKPAHEPIVVARKPLVGSVVANVLEHGTGALNVSAARIGTAGGSKSGPRPKGDALKRAQDAASTGFAPHAEYSIPLDAGRWPANVALLHLAECKGSGPNHTDVLCAEGCPVALLNEQSGDRAAGWRDSDAGPQGKGTTPFFDSERFTGQHYGDSGGAARFFYIAKPKSRERIAGTTRNLHPTVKPVELMRWLIRLVTPPGGTVLDPFLGSGTTGCAAMVEGVGFVGIERDEDYFQIAEGRISDWAFAHDRARPVAG